MEDLHFRATENTGVGVAQKLPRTLFAVYQATDVTIRNCVFDYATTKIGSPFDAYARWHNLLIEGCTFIVNNSYVQGDSTGEGGVWIRNSSTVEPSRSAVIRNCAFEKTGGSDEILAIFGFGDGNKSVEDVLVTNCTFNYKASSFGADIPAILISLGLTSGVSKVRFQNNYIHAHILKDRLFSAIHNSPEDSSIQILYNQIIVDDLDSASNLSALRMALAESVSGAEGTMGLVEVAHNTIKINTTHALQMTPFVGLLCWAHHNAIRGNGVIRTCSGVPDLEHNEIEQNPFGVYTFMGSVIGNRISEITDTALMIFLRQGTAEKYIDIDIRDNQFYAAPGSKAVIKNNASSRCKVVFSGNTVKPIYMHDTNGTMHYMDMTNNKLYVDSLDDINLPSARAQSGATWLNTRLISNLTPPVPLATETDPPDSASFSASVRSNHVFTFDNVSITCVATVLDSSVYKPAIVDDPVVAWLRNTTDSPSWVPLAAVT